MLRPTTIEDLQAAVREGGRLLPRGGGTKPALSTPTEGVTPLDLSGLSGVLEYNPGEFTFTALAGTRVAEVQALLDSHGQYLPFDPPLADRGATLGGTVAAGVSGPGRYRYGGVRDFILGVRMVDGNGDVVYGGGKVVKNSAGFDIPKLMVGSLGRLGALVELTFKVFPKAEAHITVQLHCAALQETMQALYRVYTARLDVDALDLAPETDGSATLWVRLGGLPDALPARAERIRAMLGGGDNVTGEREAWLWREARDFAWAQPDWILVKVPVTPKRIASVETLHATSLRRYSAAGNVAWIASPESPQSLDGHLSSVGLSGLMLFGPPGHARLGIRTGQAVERRVKEVFDPQNRFSET
ncbi:MAG: FAD-binding protein [Chloroflexi bacterium]|nr:FAD-binding protein [Chloroflexota bacterium]